MKDKVQNREGKITKLKQSKDKWTKQDDGLGKDC